MKRYIRSISGRIVHDIREYGMAAVALAIYTVIVNLLFHAFCPLVIVSGFPCPGCGFTRATVYFLTGQWQQAWRMNPLIFPIMLTVFYFGWNRYLLGRKAAGIKEIMIVLFVLLLLVYCVRMYLYFPNRVPYVYMEDNVLERIFPFYQHILHKLGIM